MTGWTGTVLHIDLSTGEIRKEKPDPEVYRRHIGGRGLCGYYLRDRVTLPYDNPDMPLLLFGGPLVETASPTSGRMTIMSRSPLTGTIGDSSVGGGLGTQLKKAGYDGIVITGRSPRLSGIEIDDDRIAVCDASSMAGMDTVQVRTRLEGKGSVAVIGPAAENGVLFSCIIVDGGHAAGRNGLGLVFAAKNLKYITIKGTGEATVHDPKALEKAREDIYRQIAASPVLSGEMGLMHFGTGALYDLMHTRRMMPTANFRRTYFEEARSMNAYAYKQAYAPKRAGCKGCHILCKRSAGGKHLPEFETMSHFSALIENDDLATVTAANTLCDEMGMDTISAGATLACYAEISGRKLTPAQVLLLLEDIAMARGVGVELGQGSWRYAASKGRPEISMSVKKQELPGYDPRGAYGMALAYATSTRGGCHLRAYPISHEILRKPVATDRFTFSGKARIIKIAEDMNAVVDSLTACKFVFFASSLEEYAAAFTAVTGVESTAQDLLKAGERIYYNEIMMNAMNGFSGKDDDLPMRFFTEAGSSSSEIKVPPINRDDFLLARSNYYKIRGLDEDGRPVEEKAHELGLPWKR